MIHINENGPAEAWLAVSREIQKSGDKQVAVVEFGDSDEKTSRVVKVVDGFLKERNFPTSNETKNTIFPSRQIDRNIDDLTEWYKSSYMPRYKVRKKCNGKETYFSRMIGLPGRDGEIHPNQIKFIIDLCNDKSERQLARPRRSVLQLSVRNPNLDVSKSAQSEFPCLQQVGITYGINNLTGQQEMKLQAFYPKQLLAKRALGNYLGLRDLGLYIATQTGQNFGGVTCFVGEIERGLTKSDFDKVLNLI